MDRMLSVGEVAIRLGVSVPTVRRAAERIGLAERRTVGGHRRFTETDMGQLAGRLGVTPEVPGYSPIEVKTLAALACHPFGFRSIRTLARAAHIAPTTATAALAALRRRGLVNADLKTVAEGSARDVTVYRLRPGPEWSRIASTVSRTITPITDDQAPPATRIPRHLRHHFWNVDPTKLRLPADEQFVARRLLLVDDPVAWAWAARNLSRAAMASVRNLRGVDGPTAAMIDNLMNAA